MPQLLPIMEHGRQYGVIVVTNKNREKIKKLSETYSGSVSVASAQNLPKYANPIHMPKGYK